VLLYILLSGFHPFDPDGVATADALKAATLGGQFSLAAPEWRNVSREAKALVRALLEPDPAKRLTASELVNHPWVRGDNVSTQPLPDTHERLRAYTKVNGEATATAMATAEAAATRAACAAGCVRESERKSERARRRWRG
jgi:serine/threonine protein kinase